MAETPLRSDQLAASPANTEVLTTDGTNNVWSAASTFNQNIWKTINGTDTTSTTSVVTIQAGSGGISVATSGDGASLTIGIGANNDDISCDTVSADEQIQAGTDFRLISTTANTGGGLKRMLVEATSGALSGPTGTITLNIPEFAKLISAQLRVDTAVTGAVAITAAYSGGATQVIVAALNCAKNSKSSVFFDENAATAITSGAATQITLTAVGSNFTGGVVRAVVYYEDHIAMSDNP